MRTVGDALRRAARKFEKAGIDTARLDAELLLADCLSASREALHSESRRRLGWREAQMFSALVKRRCQREPVARILEHKEFWSLDFALSEATFVPRPESETVIRTALDLLPIGKDDVSILDLGTGTGCLLLSILSERPAARGLGTEVSRRALVTARNNAKALGLADRARFETANWHKAPQWDPPEAPFDLIVSNPPYIDVKDIAALPPEVRDFDPLRALDGGPGGLAEYPSIIELAVDKLARGGWLVLEMDGGQAAALSDLLRVFGFTDRGIAKDLAGRERVLYARKP